jgi:SPP1 family predicted phage head-tail adaptor
MFAGKLDRRITLQRATFAQDATGQQVPSWADLATVWAAKLNVSDGERMAASEVAAQIDLRFQIRWSTDVADLNAKDRVIFEGLTFDIAGTKELGRREGIEISASARSDL